MDHTPEDAGPYRGNPSQVMHPAILPGLEKVTVSGVTSQAAFVEKQLSGSSTYYGPLKVDEHAAIVVKVLLHTQKCV